MIEQNNTQQPFFSIIIPSFLGAYDGAASDRDTKIYRSLNSVFQQTFNSYEVVFVADGCEKSMAVARQYNDQRMRSILIDKSPVFSGTPRNEGMKIASGKYVIYLDIDDFIGRTHLDTIHREIVANNEPYWVFFDDWIAKGGDQFARRVCDHKLKFRNGTSNIAHRKHQNLNWGAGYLHDFLFIQQLRKVFGEPVAIQAPEYYVCHIPKLIDV